MKKNIRIYFPGTGAPHPSIELEADQLKKRDYWVSFLALLYQKDSAKKTGQPFEPNNQAEARAYAGTQDLINGSDVPALAKAVAEELKQLLVRNDALKVDLKIELTVIGFSRGAVCGLILAELLSDIAKDRLEINLMLFDPVSGDIIKRRSSSVSHDVKTKEVRTSKPLIEQCSDLSCCAPLKRVLCWYSSKNLSSESMTKYLNPYFATVVPKWPPECDVQELIYPKDHYQFLPACQLKQPDPEYEREAEVEDENMVDVSSSSSDSIRSESLCSDASLEGFDQEKPSTSPLVSQAVNVPIIYRCLMFCNYSPNIKNNSIIS